jgi:hypothetical protein
MLRIDQEAAMWKITTRGFTLQEVLIMAAMNLLENAASTPKPEKRHCRNSRRPSMELKYSIKRAVVVLSVLALVSITAAAQ